ncbi:ABC transporter permease [Rhodococcus ruber]|nr:multidrug ABC transporter permease [Rhodococcus ruber]
MTASWTGMRPLLRATVEQDRGNVAPWIVLVTALSVSSVLAYGWVFPDAASRRTLDATLGANPALRVVFGPARDLTYADGFNAWRAGALGAFFTALMAILAVTRNSRAHEDSGQAELVASGVVGRQARLATAVAWSSLASVVLGVVCASATILVGGGVADSVTLAATFTASGLVFGALAAVTAQLGSYAPTANTLAVGVLGACLLVRAYVDVVASDGWAIWTTPLGWVQQVRPASGNDWWPLAACLALTAVLLLIAFVLQARRDFGVGVIAPSPGPAEGGAATNVWGLALRLHRGALAAWTTVFVALGVVFGFMSTTFTEVFADNPALGSLLGSGRGSLVFGFVVTMLQLMGIVAAVFGVQVMMRLRAEELALRVEPVLAGALTRTRFFASHAGIALLAPAATLLVGATLFAYVSSARGGRIAAGDLIRQALVTIPAVWVLVGLAVAVIGARPRGRMLGWLGVVAAFALTILGPLFRLWNWILGISPFRHVPVVTAAPPQWLGLAVLTVVATLFVAVGFAGFRHRDVG